MGRVLLVLSLLLTACSCPVPVQVGVVDEGFMVEGTKTFRPGALPFSIIPDWTVQDAQLVPDIVARWNGWVGANRGVMVADGEAQVILSIGYVPSGEDEMVLGVSHVRFAEDGTVLGGEIILSSDYNYGDRDFIVTAGCHEVGHAVFALADDPGPPTTVDLRSIMSSPLDPLGELTQADLERIEPYLP